ncbi:MAG: NAD(P)H-dependent oxidoreductase [Bacteroidota bacterium]|nr:NAD(P)H-dependent oxidoreductase [Bacteroidota bacterium]
MITLIAGTNRPESNTRRVVNYYSELLQERQMAHQILDLCDLPADFAYTSVFHPDGNSPNMQPFIDLINHSTAVIMVVPEYNGSFPGVLKSFIDGLNWPTSLSDKVIALTGISTGVMGGALALSHLTDVLHYYKANVLPYKPRLAAIHRNISENGITNALYIQLINDQLSALERHLHHDLTA